MYYLTFTMMSFNDSMHDHKMVAIKISLDHPDLSSLDLSLIHI